MLKIYTCTVVFKLYSQVFQARSEIPEPQVMQPIVGLPTVCLTNREYYGMIIVMFIFMGLMIVVTITAGIYYKYVLF